MRVITELIAIVRRFIFALCDCRLTFVCFSFLHYVQTRIICVFTLSLLTISTSHPAYILITIFKMAHTLKCINQSHGPTTNGHISMTFCIYSLDNIRSGKTHAVHQCDNDEKCVCCVACYCCQYYNPVAPWDHTANRFSCAMCFLWLFCFSSPCQHTPESVQLMRNSKQIKIVPSNTIWYIYNTTV